jgi:hypothetical protein
MYGGNNSDVGMKLGAGVVEIGILDVNVGLVVVVLHVVEGAAAHETARTAIICMMRAKIPSLCLAITSGQREKGKFP